jgi:hypothetical protein
MMTRARIIQRCNRVKLLFSAEHQQICFSPAATAPRRSGNDLGTMIKYLRKITSGSEGYGLGAPV